MRRLIATEYITLDGVMDDPGGAEKTTFGGWSFQFWNAEAAQFKFDELFASGALLLGRLTYEGFARAWPTMQDEAGFADRMNNLPKYVVSSTLDQAGWNNSTLIKKDFLGEIARLKQQPGKDILLAGSARLFQTLLDQNLIDEVRLMVHPVIVGGGKRLFREGGNQKVLKLVETRPFTSGIVLLTYQAAPAS